jgi:hypothetical protein
MEQVRDSASRRFQPVRHSAIRIGYAKITAGDCKPCGIIEFAQGKTIPEFANSNILKITWTEG